MQDEEKTPEQLAREYAEAIYMTNYTMIDLVPFDSKEEQELAPIIKYFLAGYHTRDKEIEALKKEKKVTEEG